MCPFSGLERLRAIGGHFIPIVEETRRMSPTLPVSSSVYTFTNRLIFRDFYKTQNDDNTDKQVIFFRRYVYNFVGFAPS